jgi:lysophospholipase L1-like esterase
MIVLAPSEFQVNPNLRSTVLACLGKNISDYDTEIPQRFIKNILEMENIPYVDLLPTFSKQDSRITYQNLDTHWNATGNKMAAEAIYSKIKEMRLQGHTNVN